MEGRVDLDVIVWDTKVVSYVRAWTGVCLS